MELGLFIYLLIGFFIAVAKKGNVSENRTTGFERMLWTVAWPLMFLYQFLNWIVSIYTDD